MSTPIASVSALAALTLFMVAALVTVGANPAPAQIAAVQTVQADA